MYLIDARTFTRQKFFEQSRPRYAALSHVWGPNDKFLSFSQTRGSLCRGSSSDTAKFKFCVDKAIEEGLDYVWIDACSLSRARFERRQAIRSMFQWYSEASACYVYLPDVMFATWEADFPKSKWFTRGWTLPELIAPKTVKFYSKDGRLLGDKKTLERQIVEITGIPARAIHGDLSGCSMTERMSWAADRQTSRPEDAAYSLLGICGVSMDINYGEGKQNAMRRLKYEIRKSQLTTQSSETIGMRLLLADSNPLRMVTAPVCDHLEYAILSHTWAQGEVLFDDVRLGTAEQKQGYAKIRSCCDLAVKHGFQYVWIDTCCIDKSSSSELQEAICSMYKWYNNASICYVYLEDCKHDDANSFANSRWFTRGWTLQELIAPTFVEFFDKNWAEIGTKQSLCEQIAEITSIDTDILRGADLTKCSVAKKMSWAANRFTTRDEDEAYALMGLFNVFMPTIYGEGKRAFLRLQEEIIKQTEDYSIFAWQAKGPDTTRGILAHSPAEFSNSRLKLTNCRLFHLRQDPNQNSPPVMSGRGLLLTLPMLPRDNHYLCWVSYADSREDGDRDELNLLCIQLEETQWSPRIFARRCPDHVEIVPRSRASEFEPKTIYVLPSSIDRSVKSYVGRSGELTVQFSGNNIDSANMKLLDLARLSKWIDADKKIVFPYQNGKVTLAAFRFDDKCDFVLIVGLQNNMPWCSVVTHGDMQPHGETLDDLKYLSNLEEQRLYEQPTDRAEKQLSENLHVAAAIRVARSKSKDIRNFGLHVRLSHLDKS